MKKKSTNYSTPDGGGWMHVADDLFLAGFRGRPCAVCGKTNGFYNGKTIRSMGHHLLSKELHRLYRYDPDNVITLCPKHHMGAEMSPHSHDTASQAAFYAWLVKEKEWTYVQMMRHRRNKFDNEWCYRDAYVELGGEIASKTGLMKDMRPKNHAAKIRRAEG